MLLVAVALVTEPLYSVLLPRDVSMCLLARKIPWQCFQRSRLVAAQHCTKVGTNFVTC